MRISDWSSDVCSSDLDAEGKTQSIPVEDQAPSTITYCIPHYISRNLPKRDARRITSRMQRTSILQIRVSAAEKESFELAGEIAGIPVSAWARQALRRAAASELRPMGIKVPFAEALDRKSTRLNSSH